MDWQEEALIAIKQALLIVAPTVTVEEFLAVRNMEMRRHIIEAHPEFIETQTKAVIDTDGPNKLLSFTSDSREDSDSISFDADSIYVVGRQGDRWLWLKDASTERRYLLQVPREMQRVRQALAWTFNMAEGEYKPEKET